MILGNSISYLLPPRSNRPLDLTSASVRKRTDDLSRLKPQAGENLEVRSAVKTETTVRRFPQPASKFFRFQKISATPTRGIHADPTPGWHVVCGRHLSAMQFDRRSLPRSDRRYGLVESHIWHNLPKLQFQRPVRRTSLPACGKETITSVRRLLKLRFDLVLR